MSGALTRVLLIQMLLVVASSAFASDPQTDVHSNSQRKRAIFAPRPEYPLEARQKHLTGSGVLILHIDRDKGTVTSIDIEKSIGYKILDDAAIRAFSRWHFKPGKYTKIRVPIHYTINGSQ